MRVKDKDLNALRFKKVDSLLHTMDIGCIGIAAQATENGIADAPVIDDDFVNELFLSNYPIAIAGGILLLIGVGSVLRVAGVAGADREKDMIGQLWSAYQTRIKLVRIAVTHQDDRRRLVLLQHAEPPLEVTRLLQGESPQAGIVVGVLPYRARELLGDRGA